MDLVVYCPIKESYNYFSVRRADMEWLWLVYKEGEDEMMSWLDGLKRRGLLEAVYWTRGLFRVHDLYVEFAVLESEGKLDESRDFKERRWVSIRNGDLTELERTPSGGCWQELSRLRIVGTRGDPRPNSPDRSLEGIEWRFFSNVEVLKLENFSFVQESLNLEGLKCLRSLVVYKVEGLDRLEGLEGLKNLTYFQWYFGLDVGKGYFGGETRIVGQLPVSLRVLDIEGALRLEPNAFGRCSNLSRLVLQGVGADELDLSSCSSLQSVMVWRVGNVQSLSGLVSAGRMSRLYVLEVMGCSDLADILGLDEVIGLERLVLLDCPGFEELPDLQNRTNLQDLQLGGKPYLKRKLGVEVGGCRIPRQLRDLVYECGECNEAPNLSGLERLEILLLILGRGTDKEATDLGGLKDLPALRVLIVHGCRIRSGWPDLSRSRKLEHLAFPDCDIELNEGDLRKSFNIRSDTPWFISPLCNCES